jgi:hypothetical protein
MDGSLRGQGAPLANGSNGGALCHKGTLSASRHTVPQPSGAANPITTRETVHCVTHGEDQDQKSATGCGFIGQAVQSPRRLGSEVSREKSDQGGA